VHREHMELLESKILNRIIYMKKNYKEQYFYQLVPLLN